MQLPSDGFKNLLSFQKNAQKYYLLRKQQAAASTGSSYSNSSIIAPSVGYKISL
jgi:hypothetical protein